MENIARTTVRQSVTRIDTLDKATGKVKNVLTDILEALDVSVSK